MGDIQNKSERTVVAFIFDPEIGGATPRGYIPNIMSYRAYVAILFLLFLARDATLLIFNLSPKYLDYLLFCLFLCIIHAFVVTCENKIINYRNLS